MLNDKEAKRAEKKAKKAEDKERMLAFQERDRLHKVTQRERAIEGCQAQEERVKSLRETLMSHIGMLGVISLGLPTTTNYEMAASITAGVIVVQMLEKISGQLDRLLEIFEPRNENEV